MIFEKKSITQSIFISTIASEWEKIDENLCLNLSKSMPERIRLVLQENGDTIKY